MESHPNGKLLVGLMAVSGALLLLLIIAVILLRRPDGNTAEIPFPPTPAVAAFPTAVELPRSALPTRTPLPEDPIVRLNGLPFTLPATLPDDLWVTARPNVDGQFESYTVNLDTASRDFRITFAASRTSGTTGPETSTGPRALPPVYRYRASDFERIATINGTDLLISKAGGVTLETASDSAQLIAAPAVVAPSEGSLDGRYFVYQKYEYGLSEYTNVFSALKGDEPSYDDTVVIDYTFLEETAVTEWQERKELVRNLLSEVNAR